MKPKNIISNFVSWWWKKNKQRSAFLFGSIKLYILDNFTQFLVRRKSDVFPGLTHGLGLIQRLLHLYLLLGKTNEQTNKHFWSSVLHLWAQAALWHKKHCRFWLWVCVWECVFFFDKNCNVLWKHIGSILNYNSRFINKVYLFYFDFWQNDCFVCCPPTHTHTYHLHHTHKFKHLNVIYLKLTQVLIVIDYYCTLPPFFPERMNS